MADTPASDTATLATLNDDAKRPSPAHVNIRQAEEEFTQLQRQLTHHDREGHAQSSTPQPEHLPKDLEKAPSNDVEAEELFDLREYLTSSNDASQAAGIKHKHVGVTWEDLQVTGIGGEDMKVNLPSYAGFVCPAPDISIDLCSHNRSRNPWDCHVPCHASVGSGFAPPTCQVYTCSSNSYDHSQVSLTPIPEPSPVSLIRLHHS